MKCLLFDLLTGEDLDQLSVVDATWTQTIGSPDSVKFDVPVYTESMRRLGLANLVTPKKTVIAVQEDGWADFVAAGRVGIPEWDEDSKILSIPGNGVESVLGDRLVLPFNVGNIIGPDGKPVSTYDTNLKGWEYGTIIKKLVQQAMGMPGFGLPWVFEPDRVGSREKNTEAADMKNLLELIDDITKLEGGVEVDYVSRWRTDVVGKMQTLLRTATDTDRFIASQSEFDFSIRGKKPTARKLKFKLLPTYMTSRAWFTGGKSDDRMLVARADDSYLTDRGFPFSEVLDSSHSSVKEQSTLDSYARARVAQGRTIGKFYSFDVRKSAAVGMRKGDWLTLDIKGSVFLENGQKRLRVVSMSGGTSDPEWLQVVTAEEF